MNRYFERFNFLGVVVLAALCAFQWLAIKQTGDDVARLDHVRIEQADQLTVSQNKIASTTADLDDAHQRLTLAESELTSLHDKLAAAVMERDRLANDKAQLLASLAQWQKAVAERDVAIKSANEAIQTIAAERNATIVKFNQLVSQYNALVTRSGKAGG